MSTRELDHFLRLTVDEQANAIRRLGALGWSENAIARATKLSAEMIRRILSKAGAAA